MLNDSLEYWISYLECWMPNLEYWMPNLEYWMSNLDYWMCNLEYWMSILNIECPVLNIEWPIFNIEWFHAPYLNQLNLYIWLVECSFRSKFSDSHLAWSPFYTFGSDSAKADAMDTLSLLWPCCDATMIIFELLAWSTVVSQSQPEVLL